MENVLNYWLNYFTGYGTICVFYFFVLILIFFKLFLYIARFIVMHLGEPLGSFTREHLHTFHTHTFPLMHITLNFSLRCIS